MFVDEYTLMQMCLCASRHWHTQDTECAPLRQPLLVSHSFSPSSHICTDTCCYGDKSSLNDLMVARSPLFHCSLSFWCFAPLPVLPGLVCTWKEWKGDLRNLYLGTQRIISNVPGTLDEHNCKPETFQLQRVIGGSCKHLQAECGERNNHKFLQHMRQEANRQKP